MTSTSGTKRLNRWLTSACLTLTLMPAITFAQARPTAQGRSMLAGKVAAEASGRELEGVEVQIALLGVSARTDSQGLFLLDGLPAGEHTIYLRALGFEPLSAVLAFSGRDTLARMFVLQPTPDATAATGPSEADLVLTASKLRDFSRRRAKGPGRFLTRDEIAPIQDHALSEVLRRYVPGIQLYASGRGGGIAVAGGRGVFSGALKASGKGFPSACYVQVYVDGTRVFASTTGDPPMDINVFRSSDIEAIEYFAAPTQTPPEFNGPASGCGTLSLWMRTS